MIIHLNTHPDDRKGMVKAISEQTGLDAAYMGPPSSAYQIGGVRMLSPLRSLSAVNVRSVSYT